MEKRLGGESVERDRNLQDLWSRKGLNVIHDPKSHVKSISTPVGVISGSANLTDNGSLEIQSI